MKTKSLKTLKSDASFQLAIAGSVVRCVATIAQARAERVRELCNEHNDSHGASKRTTVLLQEALVALNSSAQDLAKQALYMTKLPLKFEKTGAKSF